jgi:hypothetical protein
MEIHVLLFRAETFPEQFSTGTKIQARESGFDGGGKEAGGKRKVLTLPALSIRL